MFAASKTARAAAAGATTDPYFPYVPLLLETGAASTRSTTVTDGAATPNTVTRNGTPSTGWTSPYQTTGYWSGYFGGSDSLNLATNAIPASGAFTFETWVYVTGTAASQNIIAQYPNGTATGRFQILWNDTSNKFTAILGSSNVFVSDATYSTNTWLHLVVQRDASNVWSMYVNGTRNTSTVSNSTAIDTAATYIGNRNTGGTPYTGYISNLRVVSGTAVYSGSTYTVPTTPLTAITNTSLLTLQDNRFKDNSTNAFAITTAGSPQTTPYYYPSGFSSPTASPGAGLFNGSTDYLSVPSSTALGVSSSDFTVETWVYFTDVTGYQIVFDARTAQPSQSPLITLQNTSRFQYLWNGVSFVNFGPTTLSPYVWYHVAVVRASGVHTGYVNGVSYSLSTTDAAGVSSAPVILGARTVGGANDYLKGYLSNFRFVKGTAVYTGAFTPPSNFVTQTGGTYPSTTNVNTSIPSANTSLLLNLADSNYTSATNGVQNNTFIDSSNYAFPITRNGTPTQGAFTPYQPSGYWSGYFNGSTDYLSSTASTVLQFGSNPYTIEGWIYQTSRSGSPFICGGIFSGTGMQIGIDASGFIYVSIPGVANLTSATIAIPLNTWTHFACVRSSTSAGGFTYYINGVAAGTPTDANNYSGTSTTFNVATTNNSSLYVITGYLSNFRIVKGTAVYTSAFTPSTTPLTAITNTSLLTLQNNRFIDNSTNAFAITVNGTPKVQAFQPFSPAASYSAATYGGSGYFNGTSDYLTTPITASGPLDISTTTTYTIEAWVYWTASAGNKDVWSWEGKQTGGASAYYQLYWATSGNVLKWEQSNTSGILTVVTTSLTPTLNTWYHIAIVRSGSAITVYANGQSVGTGTYAPNDQQFVEFALGSLFFNTGYIQFFPGYISNFRFVKGTAVYTGAFTPPTLAPLTTSGSTSAASYSSTTNVNTSFAASNTSLLTNFTNAGIYDAAWQNVVTTVADAQASTTITAKWPPTSMKFDGTLDCLTVPTSNGFGLGTGDWTIEFWVYLNVSATQNLVSMATTTGVGSVPHVYYAGGSGIRYYVNAADRITGGALTTGVWNYIAIVKSSNVTKMYINGTQTGSNYTDTNNYGTSNPFFVGDYSVPLTGVSTLNGYVQDVRITKGVARTITTPTAAFPTR